MNTYTFDTLEQSKNLQRYGFDETEAQGLVEVIAISTSNFATKQDLEQVKLELRLDIQQECNKVRQELRQEINETRRELTDFKEETRREFHNVHLSLAKLDKKILSMTISLSVVIVSALGGYTYLLQLLQLLR